MYIYGREWWFPDVPAFSETWSARSPGSAVYGRAPLRGAAPCMLVAAEGGRSVLLLHHSLQPAPSTGLGLPAGQAVPLRPVLSIPPLVGDCLGSHVC